MQRLLQWLEYPIHALLWLGMLAAVFMMFHVSADVVGRTVFNHPLEGTTEMVSAYYMVAVSYLPWAWIARNDAHIMVGTFTAFASPRFIKWLDLIVKIVTAIGVAFFVWRRHTISHHLAEPLGAAARRRSHGPLPHCAYRGGCRRRRTALKRLRDEHAHHFAR